MTTSTLGSSLFHFYVHDVRLADRRDHREVGSGIIDFGKLLRLLELELEEEDRIGALKRSKARLEECNGNGGDD